MRFFWHWFLILNASPLVIMAVLFLNLSIYLKNKSNYVHMGKIQLLEEVIKWKIYSFFSINNKLFPGSCFPKGQTYWRDYSKYFWWQLKERRGNFESNKMRSMWKVINSPGHKCKPKETTQLQTTQLQNRQKIWADSSSKKIYRWQIDIWKYVQYCMLIGKYKLKQQQDTTTNLLEWLKSKTLTIPNAGKEVSYRILRLFLVERQNGIGLWKRVWKFLAKLNILLAHDPEIFLPGIYPNEFKNYVHMPWLAELIEYSNMFILNINLYKKIDWSRVDYHKKLCPHKNLYKGIASLFIIVKTPKQQDILQQVNR